MELERSCGAVRERESSAVRQFRRMEGISPSLSGNAGRHCLYVMQADGSNARIVADSLSTCKARRHGHPTDNQ